MQEQYPVNKIIVDIIPLGYDVRLSFVVVLLRRMKNKYGTYNTYGPYREVVYMNEKYEQRVRNINVTFEYYLTLRFSSKLYGKSDVMIMQSDCYWLKRFLKETCKDIYGNYSKIFKVDKNGELSGLNKKEIKPHSIDLRFCNMQIDPAVNSNENGMYDTINITITNSSGNIYVGHMWRDSLSALTTIVDKMDMFQYAYMIASPYLREYYNVFDVDSMSIANHVGLDLYNPSTNTGGFGTVSKPARGSISFFKTERNVTMDPKASPELDTR